MVKVSDQFASSSALIAQRCCCHPIFLNRPPLLLPPLLPRYLPLLHRFLRFHRPPMLSPTPPLLRRFDPHRSVYGYCTVGVSFGSCTGGSQGQVSNEGGSTSNCGCGGSCGNYCIVSVGGSKDEVAVKVLLWTAMEAAMHQVGAAALVPVNCWRQKTWLRGYGG